MLMNPPLIALLASVAIICLAAVLVRGGPLITALGVLLAGTCFGYYFFFVETKPVPLTADRALFAVLVAQCLVCRRLGITLPRPLARADLVLLAFLGYLGVSTLANDWAWQRYLPLSRLLFYYLMPAGIYWAARQIRFSQAKVWLTFGFLVVLGVYMAATGVFEWLRLRALVWPSYIASPEHPEFFGRGRGPLLNPIGNGYFITIGLCAVIMWWPTANRRGRLAVLVTSALLAGGVFATLTRCCWLGALATLFIVAALTLPRSWRLPVLAGSMLVVGVAALSQWQRLMEFERDEGRSARETADSATLRPILAVVAWRMFLEQPLFGCGFGHYREHFVEVIDRTSELPLDKARPYVQHNVFLGLLTETGLVGTTLFCMLLALWLRDAWKLWKSPAPLWSRQVGLLFLATSGSYFCNGMFQDLAIIPMINMMLFFLAGSMEGLRNAASSTQISPPPLSESHPGSTQSPASCAVLNYG